MRLRTLHQEHVLGATLFHESQKVSVAEPEFCFQFEIRRPFQSRKHNFDLKRGTAIV